MKPGFSQEPEDRPAFELAIQKSVKTESSVVPDFGTSMSISPTSTFNNPTKSETLPSGDFYVLSGTQALSRKTSEEYFIEASDIIDNVCSHYFIPDL